MERFEAQLARADPEVRSLLANVPRPEVGPRDPRWLRCEMLERFVVLEKGELRPGASVLEVGAGPHALATVPLAQAVGPTGTVVAVERARWSSFRSVVASAGVADRVGPVASDARRLPLRDRTFDMAVCVHALRSLGDRATMVRVFREMLRVAPRLFLAESLPISRTDAQRAHLQMYALRAETLRAVTGRPDDLPYPSLDDVTVRVEEAGGKVLRAGVIEVDLPHFLADLPDNFLGAIGDPRRRTELERRWKGARELAARHGTDHPPVGFVVVGA